MGGAGSASIDPTAHRSGSASSWPRKSSTAASAAAASCVAHRASPAAVRSLIGPSCSATAAVEPAQLHPACGTLGSELLDRARLWPLAARRAAPGCCQPLLVDRRRGRATGGAGSPLRTGVGSGTTAAGGGHVPGSGVSARRGPNLSSRDRLSASACANPSHVPTNADGLSVGESSRGAVTARACALERSVFAGTRRSVSSHHFVSFALAGMYRRCTSTATSSLGVRAGRRAPCVRRPGFGSRQQSAQPPAGGDAASADRSSLATVRSKRLRMMSR